MSRRITRSFGVSAVVLATLYVACADPPKKGRPNAGAGTGGAIVGEAGASDNGGTDATSGTGGTGGTAGSSGSKVIAEAGMGGEMAEAVGGEGGMGAEGGAAGAAPVDVCTTLTIGASGLPAPATTDVAKPAGSVGGLKVLNWAGFKGAISYTFDDNLQSQITHYSKLHAVGVPMTFYIVGSTNSANPVWVQAAKDGHEIGNHTMHHCYNRVASPNCSWGTYAGADKEIDQCTTVLKSALGLTGVYTMAGPFGDPNWSAPASERFIINRGISDDPNGVAPNGNTSPFDIPCHLSSLDETAAGSPGFNTITDSVRTKGSWRTILVHNVDPTIMDYGYNPVKLDEIVAAMTYTKSVGDVWADTMVHVGAYWLAQKGFNLQPATVGTSKVYSWTLPAHFPPGQHLRITVTGGKVQQCGTELAWDSHGYYEINLDAGSVTVSP
ncbi:MAG TPA: polysaccharide deacetylase family protein [Polyangiaceae bacterium]|nr:polysaccharide deacetylase family protein [Polyangiaceae bacterium]